MAVDSNAAPGRWLLTGSENLVIRSRVGQSLAGRSGHLGDEGRPRHSQRQTRGEAAVRRGPPSRERDAFGVDPGALCRVGGMEQDVDHAVAIEVASGKALPEPGAAVQPGHAAVVGLRKVAKRAVVAVVAIGAVQDAPGPAYMSMVTAPIPVCTPDVDEVEEPELST